MPPCPSSLSSLIFSSSLTADMLKFIPHWRKERNSVTTIFYQSPLFLLLCQYSLWKGWSVCTSLLSLSFLPCTPSHYNLCSETLLPGHTTEVLTLSFLMAMSSHSGWCQMSPRCLLLCSVLHPLFLSCPLPGDSSLCFLAFPSSLVLSSLYLLLHTPWAQLLSLIIMVVMIRSIATVSFCSLIQDSLNCLWSCPEWPGSFSNHVAVSFWNCRFYIHNPSFQFTQNSIQSGL